MISIKALLSGLMLTSLCMANISGIVTDLSSNFPIVGALVKLEKGGQSAISDGDGKFTI